MGRRSLQNYQMHPSSHLELIVFMNNPGLMNRNLFNVFIIFCVVNHNLSIYPTGFYEFLDSFHDFIF